MATSQTNAFERVMPRRELLRGPGRGVWLWSALSSLVLCALLFDVFLIADLMVHRGRLDVLAEEVPEWELLTGKTAAIGASGVHFENSGMLPTVWWSRHSPYGPLLTTVYRRAEVLHDNSGALTALMVTAIVLGLLRSLLLSRARVLAAHVAQLAATRLRQTLHRQTLRIGPSDLQDADGANVNVLFTQDVERVRRGVAQWIAGMARHPWELLVLVLFALSLHPRVTLQCLIPLAGCWYMLRRQRERVEAERRKSAARVESELRLLAESFRRTRLVRGFGMENFESERFRHHLDRYSNRVNALERGERWSRWAGRLLVIFCVAVVLFLMGIKVLLPETTSGGLAFAAALTLVGAFVLMRTSVETLWQLPSERRAAAESADRIFRYLNQIPEVSQAVGAKFLQPLSKLLQFESVTYSAPNQKMLLDGFDLKIAAGQSVACVSLDPLQSRAAAYMLPRFIEPQEGRILVDGEDIAWVTLESLRAETIYVSGSDAYFTGTIRENISCGNPRYSMQDITEAAKMAHAHNFIVKLQQGYDTVIGEHGETLDAGESFRLGLARAMLRDPALLIIEEPEETLDDDTKSLLDDAYQRITEGRTVIFLPSRLSTLRRVDRIVLIHRGKVEAIGRHAELIKQAPLYRHWEYMRYNEFRE